MKNILCFTKKTSELDAVRPDRNNNNSNFIYGTSKASSMGAVLDLSLRKQGEATTNSKPSTSKASTNDAPIDLSLRKQGRSTTVGMNHKPSTSKASTNDAVIDLSLRKQGRSTTIGMNPKPCTSKTSTNDAPIDLSLLKHCRSTTIVMNCKPSTSKASTNDAVIDQFLREQDVEATSEKSSEPSISTASLNEAVAELTMSEDGDESTNKIHSQPSTFAASSTEPMLDLTSSEDEENNQIRPHFSKCWLLKKIWYRRLTNPKPSVSRKSLLDAPIDQPSSGSVEPINPEHISRPRPKKFWLDSWIRSLEETDRGIKIQNDFEPNSSTVRNRQRKPKMYWKIVKKTAVEMVGTDELRVSPLILRRKWKRGTNKMNVREERYIKSEVSVKEEPVELPQNTVEDCNNVETNKPNRGRDEDDAREIRTSKSEVAVENGKLIVVGPTDIEEDGENIEISDRAPEKNLRKVKKGNLVISELEIKIDTMEQEGNTDEEDCGEILDSIFPMPSRRRAEEGNITHLEIREKSEKIEQIENTPSKEDCKTLQSNGREPRRKIKKVKGKRSNLKSEIPLGEMDCMAVETKHEEENCENITLSDQAPERKLKIATKENLAISELEIRKEKVERRKNTAEKYREFNDIINEMRRLIIAKESKMAKIERIADTEIRVEPEKKKKVENTASKEDRKTGWLPERRIIEIVKKRKKEEKVPSEKENFWLPPNKVGNEDCENIELKRQAPERNLKNVWKGILAISESGIKKDKLEVGGTAVEEDDSEVLDLIIQMPRRKRAKKESIADSEIRAAAEKREQVGNTAREANCKNVKTGKTFRKGSNVKTGTPLEKKDCMRVGSKLEEENGENMEMRCQAPETNLKTARIENLAISKLEIREENLEQGGNAVEKDDNEILDFVYPMPENKRNKKESIADSEIYIEPETKEQVKNTAYKEICKNVKSGKTFRKGSNVKSGITLEKKDCMRVGSKHKEENCDKMELSYQAPERNLKTARIDNLAISELEIRKKNLEQGRNAVGEDDNEILYFIYPMPRNKRAKKQSIADSDIRIKPETKEQVKNTAYKEICKSVKSGKTFRQGSSVKTGTTLEKKDCMRVGSKTEEENCENMEIRCQAPETNLKTAWIENLAISKLEIREENLEQGRNAVEKDDNEILDFIYPMPRNKRAMKESIADSEICIEPETKEQVKNTAYKEICRSVKSGKTFRKGSSVKTGTPLEKKDCMRVGSKLEEENCENMEIRYQATDMNMKTARKENLAISKLEIRKENLEQGRNAVQKHDNRILNFTDPMQKNKIVKKESIEDCEVLIKPEMKEQVKNTAYKEICKNVKILKTFRKGSNVKTGTPLEKNVCMRVGSKREEENCENMEIRYQAPERNLKTARIENLTSSELEIKKENLEQGRNVVEKDDIETLDFIDPMPKNKRDKKESIEDYEVLIKPETKVQVKNTAYREICKNVKSGKTFRKGSNVKSRILADVEPTERMESIVEEENCLNVGLSDQKEGRTNANDTVEDIVEPAMTVDVEKEEPKENCVGVVEYKSLEFNDCFVPLDHQFPEIDEWPHTEIIIYPKNLVSETAIGDEDEFAEVDCHTVTFCTTDEYHNNIQTRDNLELNEDSLEIDLLEVDGEPHQSGKRTRDLNATSENGQVKRLKTDAAKVGHEFIKTESDLSEIPDDTVSQNLIDQTVEKHLERSSCSESTAEQKVGQEPSNVTPQHNTSKSMRTSGEVSTEKEENLTTHSAVGRPPKTNSNVGRPPKTKTTSEDFFEQESKLSKRTDFTPLHVISNDNQLTVENIQEQTSGSWSTGGQNVGRTASGVAPQDNRVISVGEYGQIQEETEVPETKQLLMSLLRPVAPSSLSENMAAQPIGCGRSRGRLDESASSSDAYKRNFVRPIHSNTLLESTSNEFSITGPITSCVSDAMGELNLVEKKRMVPETSIVKQLRRMTPEPRQTKKNSDFLRYLTEQPFDNPTSCLHNSEDTTDPRTEGEEDDAEYEIPAYLQPERDTGSLPETSHNGPQSLPTSGQVNAEESGNPYASDANVTLVNQEESQDCILQIQQPSHISEVLGKLPAIVNNVHFELTGEIMGVNDNGDLLLDRMVWKPKDKKQPAVLIGSAMIPHRELELEVYYGSLAETPHNSHQSLPTSSQVTAEEHGNPSTSYANDALQNQEVSLVCVIQIQRHTPIIIEGEEDDEEYEIPAYLLPEGDYGSLPETSHNSPQSLPPSSQVTAEEHGNPSTSDANATLVNQEDSQDCNLQIQHPTHTREIIGMLPTVVYNDGFQLADQFVEVNEDEDLPFERMSVKLKDKKQPTVFVGSPIIPHGDIDSFKYSKTE